ncbi:hypothetical protein PIB30_038936 [Stylosanthes scabra]|uniref:Uncharacterized protein n=1 Tax=Stylosanthes scabra TaxID=79078 RepID=A0ABU6TDZ6_9FABA|nr:hypothetical protein [Stylosanthes scabra]
MLSSVYSTPEISMLAERSPSHSYSGRQAPQLSRIQAVAFQRFPGLDVSLSRAPLHPRTLAPISDFSQVCPSKEENAAVAVRRGRGRPRRPCHSFSPSVQPQPPLTAHRSRRKAQFSLSPTPINHISATTVLAVTPSPSSSLQSCCFFNREKGEHPSHASQSRESEIASSSFSPVSGPEGNSLHCLVKLAERSPSHFYSGRQAPQLSRAVAFQRVPNDH